MDIQHKTNEQLQKELLELRQENNSLKELIEKADSIRKSAYDEMLETNLKLTLALQGGNMAWWEMDVPTGHVTFDKHKVEMLGYPPENFKHYTDFTALVHPNDYKRIMNAMRGHLEGTLDTYEAEYRIMANSGEYIWFYDYGSVVKKDLNGKPLIVAGFVFNITHKKKDEERFLLINRAVESTSDAIAISDSQGHHYYHNKALSDLFGYETAEELKASGGGIAIVKDPAIAKKMVETILHGKSLSGELEMVTKSGRVFPAYGRTDAITDKEGNIIGVIGIIKDITEQKHAERVLGDLIEKNPISIQIMDKEGFTLKVNPAHFLLFGPPPPPDFSMFEELQNKGFGKYILLAKNGEVVHFPDIYYNVHDANAELHDKPVWIRAVLFPLTDQDGIIERFVFIHEDITQRKLAEEKLRESENKLQAIFDTVGAGILIIDKKSKRIIEANETTLKMTGLPKEQILNHICHSLVCSAKAGKCPVNYFGENVEESEQKLLCADGQIKDILKTVYPITIKGRDCYLESFVDITERKKAEKALKESEDRYRTIFESSTIGIYRTTPEGQILMSNPALIELLGYSSFDELANRNLEEKGFEPSFERIRFVDVMKREGIVNGMESAWTKMNGTTLAINESARAIKDEQGKIIYYDGIVEDITLRKQGEGKLLKSEQMFQMVLDNFPGVIFWKDRRLNYLGCNQAFANAIGLINPVEVVGKTDLEMPWTSTEAIDYIKDDMAVINSGEARLHIIEKLRQSDGEVKWIDTSKLPLRDSNGQIIGVIGLSNDISMIKKVEMELLDTNKELFFQNEEKEKRATELIMANQELAFQFAEKEKRAAELSAINLELTAQNIEIEELAAEQMLAEKQIIENSRRNHALLKAIPDLMFRINDQGEFLDYKANRRDELYFPAESIIGQNAKDILSPEIAGLVTQNSKIVLETGELQTFDYSMKLLSGLTFFEARMAKSGEKEVVAVIRNITERKAAAEEIQKLNAELEIKVKKRTEQLGELNKNLLKEIEERKYSEQKVKEKEESLREAQRMAKMAGWESDMVANDTTWSDNTFGMLGFKPDEHNSSLESFISKLHPDDIHFLSEYLIKIMQCEKPAPIELRIIEPDGSIKWVHNEIEAVAKDEKVIKLKGVLIDITDRKEFEREIKEAKAEAERANVAKSEFLSRMSHELRTPMNSILGFAQLMDMGKLTPAHKKGVNHIMRSGKHLLELINEVLDLSRIEAGKLSIALETVHLRGIVSEATDVLKPFADQLKITLAFRESKMNDLFVRADRQKLMQVLLNLINNAVKYNREGGSVRVVCEDRRPKSEDRSQKTEVGRPKPSIGDPALLTSDLRLPTVRIRVIDTGKGIAPQDIQKLFNPFQRIGSEVSEVEGTGLGLAVAKKLMEAMDGAIGVESKPGAGSTFWIELPLDESWVNRREQKGDFVEPETGSTVSGTILYIEDNQPNIELVEEILETHRPQINLISEMYGMRAVKLATANKPDFVLLDLNLPDIHGSEVLKHLLSNDETKSIPVVILTSDVINSHIEKLMKAGAKKYLTKPLDVLEFLRVVDEVMKNKIK